MAKFNQSDVFDHFIGSGALSWEWWAETGHLGIDERGDASDGWYVEVEFGVPGEDEVYPMLLDAHRIWAAVAACASGHLNTVPRALAEECTLFIFKPEATDFDAATADQVLQVAACGQVIYR